MILPPPMLLHTRKRTAPFDRPGWVFELKFDGYRLMAGVDQGQVQLATRGGTDATRWFPEIVQGLAQLPGGPHIIDGEVCVLDERGVSQFELLQQRASRRCYYPNCDPVVFCAFDLLAVDGRSIIGERLELRKARLATLLSRKTQSVLYVGHFPAEHGRVLFEQAVHQLKLEGLVAKRLGSKYQPGERTEDWIKVKRPGAVQPGRFPH
jgi:bifunctional non-homologous end joining protein LigD